MTAEVLRLEPAITDGSAPDVAGKARVRSLLSVLLWD